MKPSVKLALSIIVGGAVMTLANGCATAPANGHALVCPQCKEVTITRTVTVFDESEAHFSPQDKEVTETSHSCPGCQGALVTFFKEGKLRHECSICEQTPFSCSIGNY